MTHNMDQIFVKIQLSLLYCKKIIAVSLLLVKMDIQSAVSCSFGGEGFPHVMGHCTES